MPPTESPHEPLLKWTVHPVKRKPLVSAALTSFILITPFLIYWSWQSVWLSGLAVVVLFGSLAKFYLPTTYVLDETGVTVKMTTHSIRKDWTFFRSFYQDKNGILLSPFAGPSRLENFRGLYLMTEQNAAQVAAIIAAHMPHAEAPEARKQEQA